MRIISDIHFQYNSRRYNNADAGMCFALCPLRDISMVALISTVVITGNKSNKSLKKIAEKSGCKCEHYRKMSTNQGNYVQNRKESLFPHLEQKKMSLLNKGANHLVLVLINHV